MKFNCLAYLSTLLCCILISVLSSAQQKPLSIHVSTPAQMHQGEALKLKVQVKHQIEKEQTGHIQLYLYNAETKQSVDGWFLNFFPFQYFTTIANEVFETEFPFTVPFDFKGKFIVELVAKVDTLQDSVRIIIPTKLKQ